MKKLPLLLLPLLSGAFVLQVAEGETVTSHSGLRMKQSGPAISAQNTVTDAVFQAMKKEFAAGKKVEIKFMSGRPYLEHESGTIQTEQSYKDRGWILMISDKGVFNNREEILFDPHFINGYNQIHDAVIEVKVTEQEEEEEEGEGDGDGEGEEEEGEEGEGEEVGNRTPVVENVTAAQVEGTKILQIFYDLKVSDGHPCVVTVKWSTDSGKTFPLTATSLVGEAGPGIDPGDGLAITWDMGKDWDNKFTDSGRIQIIASRIPHDYVPGGGSETGGHSEGDHSEGDHSEGEGGNSETGI